MSYSGEHLTRIRQDVTQPGPSNVTETRRVTIYDREMPPRNVEGNLLSGLQSISELENPVVAAIVVYRDGAVDVAPMNATNVTLDVPPGQGPQGTHQWSQGFKISTYEVNPCFTYIEIGGAEICIEYPC